jgi:ribosomal protein S6--L-glutamate ligase
LNIGVITVRDNQYHPNQRLQEAGKELGHQVDLIHPYQTWPAFQKTAVSLVGERSLALPDVVLPRQGAEIGESCLSLIRQYSLQGISVVNDVKSINLSRNQFSTLQALAAVDIPFPDTVFVNSAEGFFKAIEQLGGFPVVVKQVSGRQGKSISRITGKEDAEAIIYNSLDKYFGLLVQQFISPKDRKDIRVLVVGREIIGAMTLEPKDGDFRANFHLTGSGKLISLTHDQRKIATRSVEAVGLEIAGVDLMVSEQYGIHVVEVNYSPGFQGLEAVTGIDVAAKIIQYAAERYHK